MGWFSGFLLLFQASKEAGFIFQYTMKLTLHLEPDWHWLFQKQLVHACFWGSVEEDFPNNSNSTVKGRQ